MKRRQEGRREKRAHVERSSRRERRGKALGRSGDRCRGLRRGCDRCARQMDQNKSTSTPGEGDEKTKERRKDARLAHPHPSHALLPTIAPRQAARIPSVHSSSSCAIRTAHHALTPLVVVRDRVAVPVRRLDEIDRLEFVLEPAGGGEFGLADDLRNPIVSLEKKREVRKGRGNARSRSQRPTRHSPRRR